MSSARRDAIFALTLWKEQGIFPKKALAGCDDYRTALDLVGTVLRRKRALEWVISQCVTRRPSGDLQAALMVGVAQLLFMPGMAEHAAVSETVAAAKPIGRQAAGFVNAVLRRIQRDKDTLLKGLSQQPEAIQLNLPTALYRRWVHTYGADCVRAMGEAMMQPTATWIRPLPPYTAPDGCTPHPDDPDGTFRIPRGTRVDTLPGFAEGHFVVQDPATRFAVAMLDIRPGQSVLDACAAPGGKTAQIAARLQYNGILVANELSPDRIGSLRDTLQRCRALPFVRLCEGDAAQAPHGPFDRILLDVPCSNTGVFGRRPDARWTWSEKKMQTLCNTQSTLLNACAKRLAPNGKLIYSTCSVEPEENRLQIDTFLKHHTGWYCPEEHLTLPSANSDGSYAAVLMRSETLYSH